MVCNEFLHSPHERKRHFHQSVLSPTFHPRYPNIGYLKKTALWKELLNLQFVYKSAWFYPFLYRRLAMQTKGLILRRLTTNFPCLLTNTDCHLPLAGIIRWHRNAVHGMGKSWSFCHDLNLIDLEFSSIFDQSLNFPICSAPSVGLIWNHVGWYVGLLRGFSSFTACTRRRWDRYCFFCFERILNWCILRPL